MTVQYGPWIAFNPGDTPPADDVVVQVHLASETRDELRHQRLKEKRSNLWTWTIDGSELDIIAYRVVKQPVRGEVVFSGSLHDHFSLHPDRDYRNPDKPARVTFPTADGLLIPGTYHGPDGATIKIEAL
jgi:hypothetical protein